MILKPSYRKPKVRVKLNTAFCDEKNQRGLAMRREERAIDRGQLNGDPVPSQLRKCHRERVDEAIARGGGSRQPQTGLLLRVSDAGPRCRKRHEPEKTVLYEIIAEQEDDDFSNETAERTPADEVLRSVWTEFRLAIGRGSTAGASA